MQNNSNLLINILDLDNEVDVIGGKVLYQTRNFTCALCGITFTVESDSIIAEQKYCSECKYKPKEVVKMNYRYMLIDKINKTVKMVDAETSEAATESKHGIRHDLNYKLEFNGQEEDFAKLSKKYSKFRRI